MSNFTITNNNFNRATHQVSQATAHTYICPPTPNPVNQQPMPNLMQTVALLAQLIQQIQSGAQQPNKLTATPYNYTPNNTQTAFNQAAGADSIMQFSEFNALVQKAANQDGYLNQFEFTQLGHSLGMTNQQAQTAFNSLSQGQNFIHVNTVLNSAAQYTNASGNLTANSFTNFVNHLLGYHTSTNNQVFHTGPNNDFVNTGRGNDTLVGGPGRDQYFAGRGDTITLPNGQSFTVNNQGQLSPNRFANTPMMPNTPPRFNIGNPFISQPPLIPNQPIAAPQPNIPNPPFTPNQPIFPNPPITPNQPIFPNQPAANAQAVAVSSAVAAPQPTPAPVAIGGGATIWGDPHFVGADGGKYDVHGEAGKTYNILSDQDFQMNSLFRGAGNGVTFMSVVGFTLGTDQISVAEGGEVKVNGQVVGEGEHLNGVVTKEGREVTIKHGEYEIVLDTGTNDGLYVDFKSQNVAADGVMPHGLWGQTADGDGEARNGDQGSDAQGGGVIERTDGTITESGDKTTVQAYEVSGLFDTNFTNFNRFSGGNGNEVAVAATAQGIAE